MDERWPRRRPGKECAWSLPPAPKAPLDELAGVLTAGGTEVAAVRADVTAPADRERLLQAAADRYGGLDVLLNNAGVGCQGPFLDSSETVLRQVMEVNFFAPVELIRRAVPLLKQGQQPAVVNVTSMCGRRAMPMWAEYSASKFALVGLSESLRTELVREGIDVLTIVPGLTRTNLDRQPASPRRAAWWPTSRRAWTRPWLRGPSSAPCGEIGPRRSSAGKRAWSWE